MGWDGGARREMLQQSRQGCRYPRVGGLLDLLQHPHLGIALQDVGRMRRALDIGREVLAGAVAFHVGAGLPHLAGADVVHLAGVRNIDRLAVFTVALGQLLRVNSFIT